VDVGGTAHYEVELLPITGKVEEFLGSLPGSTSLAGATSGLLTRCVKRIGSIHDITPSLVADLLVGDRDYLVLRLREMTFGPRVDALVHCPNPACGKIMDLSFSIEDITIERKPVRQRAFSIDTDPYGVEFRLPTGAFQDRRCNSTPLAGVGDRVRRRMSGMLPRLSFPRRFHEVLF
jgi:hypothetical protein